MTCRPQLMSKLLSGLTVTFGGSLGFVFINLYKGNEQFYSDFLMPSVHRILDGESAHKMAIKFAKYNMVPDGQAKLKSLDCNLWSLNFQHPIGLAAGFDKDGEAVPGLSKLGFSFVEVGSVTPKPQEGNEKPRVFRLIEDEAIINRYGFNSAGHEIVLDNLSKSLNGLKPAIVGLNLGKNKQSDDPVQDYIQGMKTFGACPYIDYLVINISSPNTPGLRDIQSRERIEPFLDQILQAKSELNISKPLVLKISPDLDEQSKKYIARLISRPRENHSKIDGLIVSNTTVSRPSSLKSENSYQSGGLSGVPLKDMSTKMIKEMYELTGGKVPIIGVGGIQNAKDAYEKIRAGASLVQIYTALTFKGPMIVSSLASELSELMRKDGFSSIGEIIGIDAKS
ncbi:dihydroorotate dehydrogenase 2 isoform X2 [Brevipalpus obovatus]|uniref:dihydroorotate dehydrogenase 2 isoform X2 n=1 Tax=Brevipalpus obovatus TaxID=246614 RepID=UPI003D9DB25D